MIINHTIRLFVKLFILFLTSTSISSAQQIKRLDTSEGLVYGTVNVFEKDSLGFIWIGTSQGLNRFSGSGFKNYKLEEKYLFKGQEVIDIINLNGELYLISNNGSIFKYNYKKDEFELLKTIKDHKILSFTDINNKHFVIGLSKGFVIYDIIDNELSDIQYDDQILNRSIKFYNDRIYVGSPQGLTVLEYNSESKQLSKLNTLLKGRDVIDFDIDDLGQIWVGTEVNGLYKVKDGKGKRVSLGENLKKNYAIRKISFDKDKNILAAIDRLGLFVIDQDLNILKTYSHQPDNENSISQNSIYSIYVDKDNAIWLGLREGGVNIIYKEDNPFNNIKHIKNLENSIANNNIRAIHESKDGTLWYGTENGISKFKNGKWTNYNQSKELYNTAVLAIAEYENKLLLGTYGEGILEFDKATGKVTPLKLKTSVSLNFIFDLHATNKELWVSSSDSSLHFYLNNKLIHNFRIGSVRDVEQGFDDIIYAISDTGLYRINKRNNSFRKLESDIFNSVNIGYSLKLDPYNNCLWIGAKKGLYKYNLRNDSLKFANRKMTDEIGTIYSIERDNMQNIFLGSINGLWKYNIRDDFYRKYDKHDGLEIENFGVGASTQFTDGSLAFGGPKGAVIFNPADLIGDQPIKNVFLTDFKINGKQPDSTILKNDINFTQELRLNNNENSLAFKFETLKYHGSNRNIFQWQLKGVDTLTRKSYGNKEIIYSNLSPGEYELNYTAYNASGLKAGEKQLNILIKNPFWNTLWAYIGYLLLIISFIYLIVKISEAKNQKRFNENRIKFFVDVAHDIRTPVSLIQLLVQQLADQKDVEKSTELIIRNTQNLNEYVTQLLDFQKIDQKQLKLQVSKIDLKDCFLRIIDDFSPLIDKKSLNVNLEVKHVPVWFDGPKMKRIFYNLISNAIKYSNEGGKITVRSFLEDKKLRIDFIDNGIGIPEKQQNQIFNRFTRGTNVTNKGIPGTGIGLMLSKKIVELHGGNIFLKSKENEGTKFTVTLPKDPDQYREDQILHKAGEDEDDLKEIIEEEKLILLIEDNQELRTAIASELKKNYKVIEGTNGKEGLLLALSKEPDLIITDIMMPKMDGKEMCSLLKTNLKTSHIPIIMLTALADADDKIKGLETGANAYVEKPLNVPVLKATVSNLLKSTENINYILESKDTDKKLTPDESFLSEVVNLIKDNIKEQDFSIDTLCEKMGLSRSNLFRKLKKLINMSPSNLIIKIKLNHAQELMKNKTFTRISDIAYESGFGDPKYFSTLFKKNIGKTPKEFMEEF